METGSSRHINNRSKEKEGLEDDRISALPDGILLDILRLLELHTAVRVGALSRRWRRLPGLLSNLVIDVAELIPHHWSFSPYTADQVMATYTDAARRLLAPTKERSIKSMCLAFYLIEPYLRSIGHAVEGVVESGNTECLEFTVRTEVDDDTVSKEQRVLFAQRFMSFFGACPVAFGWLTSLTLQNLRFGGSDIPNILSTCSRLELLSLRRCGSGTGSILLEIDAPGSPLSALEIRSCYYLRVELTRVPKLERVVCDVPGWDRGRGESFPVRFGHVPRLRDITLGSFGMLMLSEWLSSTKNLSTMHLRFYGGEIPRQISPVFNSLRDIYFYNFNRYNLVWAVFLLEATPFLKNYSIELSPPGNDRRYRTEMDSLPCELPKFEHRNLNLLEVKRFRGGMQYRLVLGFIRLIRERAVCLKRIRLLEQCPYTKCIDIRGFPCACHVSEEEKNLIRTELADGFSSSVEISIEWMSWSD